jgi:hypothetical protein
MNKNRIIGLLICVIAIAQGYILFQMDSETIFYEYNDWDNEDLEITLHREPFGSNNYLFQLEHKFMFIEEPNHIGNITIINQDTEEEYFFSYRFECGQNDDAGQGKTFKLEEGKYTIVVNDWDYGGINNSLTECLFGAGDIKLRVFNLGYFADTEATNFPDAAFNEVTISMVAFLAAFILVLVGITKFFRKDDSYYYP